MRGQALGLHTIQSLRPAAVTACRAPPQPPHPRAPSGAAPSLSTAEGPVGAQAGARRQYHVLVADFHECVRVSNSNAFGVLYKHTNNSLRMTEDLNCGRDVKSHFLQVRSLNRLARNYSRNMEMETAGPLPDLLNQNL